MFVLLLIAASLVYLGLFVFHLIFPGAWYENDVFLLTVSLLFFASALICMSALVYILNLRWVRVKGVVNYVVVLTMLIFSSLSIWLPFVVIASQGFS